jgi:glycosyltransferase involved in cell wall biosynthesis
VAALDRPIRDLAGSSDDLRPEDRLDAILHALAQGPAGASAHIAGRGPARAGLEALATAYGLADRVRFTDAGPLTGTAVYPSARNLAHALTAPGTGPGICLEGSAPGLTGLAFAGLVEALYAAPDESRPLPSGDDRVLAGHRIAVVTNIPAHYRIPLFNALARRLAEAGAELRILFHARSYPRRAFMRREEITADHVFLRGVRRPRARGGHPLVALDLGRQLRRFGPTEVVAAGFSPVVAGWAAREARRAGAAFGLWSGETPARGAAHAGIVGRSRRSIAGAADFGLAYGWTSAAYLRRLSPGLPVAIVRNAAPAPTPSPRRGSGPVEVLTIADLSTPGKNVGTLIDAVARMSHPDVRLTVVGGGAPLEDLRSRAASSGDRVTFTGPIASDRVLDFYGRADVFAFPSTVDVFGLALLEAMGAGLAVATAAQPGAVADLCVDGDNALVVPEPDPHAWAEVLERLVGDPALRDRLGAAAASTVRRRWTLEHSVDAWVAGLRLGVLTKGGR